MRAKQCHLVLSLIALGLLSLSGCTTHCMEEPERCADELHLYAGPERSAEELAIIEDVRKWGGHGAGFWEIRWPDRTLIYSVTNVNYFDPELTREGLTPGQPLYVWPLPDTFYLLPGEYLILLKTHYGSATERRFPGREYGTVKLEAGHKYRVDREYCDAKAIIFRQDCSPYTTSKTMVFLEDMSTGEILLGHKPRSTLFE